MRRLARKLLQHIGADKASPPPPRVVDDRPAAPVADVPVARFDKLSTDSVVSHLDDLTMTDLTALGHHERTHQQRTRVLAEIDARLGHEPWPGYDALDVDGVRFGLEGADLDRFVMVLAYERAHRNRAGVVLAAQQHAV